MVYSISNIKLASGIRGDVEIQLRPWPLAPQKPAVTSVLSVMPAQKDGREAARTRA